MAPKRRHSFFTGLMAGLASPYTLFEPFDPRDYLHGEDLVTAAWRDVGRAFQAAMDIERQRHEQDARATAETA